MLVLLVSLVFVLLVVLTCFSTPNSSNNTSNFAITSALFTIPWLNLSSVPCLPWPLELVLRFEIVFSVPVVFKLTAALVRMKYNTGCDGGASATTGFVLPLVLAAALTKK